MRTALSTGRGLFPLLQNPPFRDKMAGEGWYMKILFINLPYTGHVVPTIGLVRELVRAMAQEVACAPGNAGAVRIVEDYCG